MKYFIFTQSSDKVISRQTVFDHMKKEVKVMLGKDYVKLAHPHVLRHSRAIHLLDSGMKSCC